MKTDEVTGSSSYIVTNLEPNFETLLLKNELYYESSRRFIIHFEQIST